MFQIVHRAQNDGADLPKTISGNGELTGSRFILSQMLCLGESKNLRIKRLIRLPSQSSDGIGQRQIAHRIAAKKEEREREGRGQTEQNRNRLSEPRLMHRVFAVCSGGMAGRCGCQGKITLTEGRRGGDIEMTSRTSGRKGVTK